MGEGIQWEWDESSLRGGWGTYMVAGAALGLTRQSWTLAWWAGNGGIFDREGVGCVRCGRCIVVSIGDGVWTRGPEGGARLAVSGHGLLSMNECLLLDGRGLAETGDALTELDVCQ